LRPMDTSPPRLRRAYFECRHGQLHVHNAIPVGGGFDELTTLICLHGSAGTGRIFLEVSKRLGNSRSIYSPDMPGCGESDASTAKLSIGGYADAIADFLDSMRFRQVDLLGVGAGAAVATELAVSRPKVVRKLYLLGIPGKETATTDAGAQGLQSAAAEWRTDRRQLVKQPVLAIENATSNEMMEASAPTLAGKLTEFFGGH
jgi:pimeloyl-ACP methyl ester carboxylesterase